MFKPYYTPKQMLEMGVFEGHYMTDRHAEFPASWFKKAKESKTPDNSINCFKIKSRLSLQEWQRRGWIIPPDERGWFQWYMRYYAGRRLPDVDAKQIARWRAMKRHSAQVYKNCTHRGANGRCTKPFECRPKQRQALLQWSHDAFI